MTKLAIPIRRQVRFDADSTTDVNYIGESSFGTSTATPTWRISRLTFTGNSFVLDYADGNDLFDNVWDDRTSLSYS